MDNLDAAISMAEINAPYFNKWDEMWARQVGKATGQGKDLDWYKEHGAPGYDLDGDMFSSPHYKANFEPKIGGLPIKTLRQP